MAETVDELTVNYHDGGVQVVKGTWATVLYKYCDWDYKKGEYGPERFTIRRYQKRGGAYQQKSKFNISSPDQARKIIDALAEWLKE